MPAGKMMETDAEQPDVNPCCSYHEEEAGYIRPLRAPSPVTTHGLVQRDLHDK